MTHWGLEFCLLEIPGGISTIGLPVSLGSLGRIVLAPWELVLCVWRRSTVCLRSAIFLGITCLWGRSADCLGISTYCLGRADCLRTNCLWGRSAGCLRSAIFLGTTSLRGRSADHLGISTHCLGRTDCLGNDYLRANCLWGRTVGCQSSTVFPGTNCLEDRGTIIKESIFTRVNNPTLNRNIAKLNLPHIWDRVLFKTLGLNLKRHAHEVGHANSNNSNTPL